MAVTIYDVAKSAGVSVATVSAVMNKRPHLRPSTRQRVLDAVEKLSYVPSQAARALVRRDRRRFDERITGNVGVIYLRSSPDDSFSENPVYYAIFEGISSETESSNLGLLFTSADSLGDALTVPRMIRERQVDGLMLIGNMERSGPAIGKLAKELPVLLVSRYVPGEDFECVVADNLSGARKAVGHLVRSGYRDIGFLSPSLANVCYAERFLGYKSALEEAGLPLSKVLVQTEFRDGDDEKAIRAYVDRIATRRSRKPVGVFASNDAVAIKAMRAAQETGIAVPQELGLVGFDDLPIGAEVVPPLTTVKVPKNLIGRTAVRKLLKIIRESGHTPEKTVLPVELVERGSCCRGETSDHTQ